MFTASEIAQVTGGRLIGEDTAVSGVSTDTRTIAVSYTHLTLPTILLV